MLTKVRANNPCLHLVGPHDLLACTLSGRVQRCPALAASVSFNIARTVSGGGGGGAGGGGQLGGGAGGDGARDRGPGHGGDPHERALQPQPHGADGGGGRGVLPRRHLLPRLPAPHRPGGWAPLGVPSRHCCAALVQPARHPAQPTRRPSPSRIADAGWGSTAPLQGVAPNSRPSPLALSSRAIGLSVLAGVAVVAGTGPHHSSGAAVHAAAVRRR